MKRYRIGRVATLLGVSPDTVRRWADAGKLSVHRTRGGQRSVDAKDLAAFTARLRKKPRAPAEVPMSRQSARNRFPGIVTRVVKDRVAAQVEVQAGPHRVVSLLTREAVDELGLAPGVQVIASVKATNVVVELANGGRRG
jgi:molybdopterin-binding protein